MILEKELDQTEQRQQERFQEAIEWVQREAETRHLSIALVPSLMEERQGDYYTFILIPVTVITSEPYDFAEALVILEDTWNEREPRPEKLEFLYPAGVPRNVV